MEEHQEASAHLWVARVGLGAAGGGGAAVQQGRRWLAGGMGKGVSGWGGSV